MRPRRRPRYAVQIVIVVGGPLLKTFVPLGRSVSRHRRQPGSKQALISVLRSIWDPTLGFGGFLKRDLLFSVSKLFTVEFAHFDVEMSLFFRDGKKSPFYAGIFLDPSKI